MTRTEIQLLLALLARPEVQINGYVDYTGYAGPARITKSGEVLSDQADDLKAVDEANRMEAIPALRLLIELLCYESVSISGQIFCTDADEQVELWKNTIGLYVKYSDPKSEVTYLHRNRSGLTSRHLISSGPKIHSTT
jgi:hypothetical protein